MKDSSNNHEECNDVDYSNEYGEYNDTDLSFVEEIEEFQQKFNKNFKENIDGWLKIFFRFPRNLILLVFFIIILPKTFLGSITTGIIYKMSSQIKFISIFFVLIFFGLDLIVHNEHKKAGVIYLIIGSIAVLYYTIEMICNYKYIR